MRRFIDDRQGGRRLLFGLIAIVVLLVIDVVLIALALRAQDAPGTGDAAPSAAATAPAAEPEATGDQTEPAPSASEPDLIAAEGDGRIVAAVDASTAWRGTRGSCAEPGTFELTTDGGATWAPAGLEVTGAVLSLQPSDDGRRGLVVLADEQCAPVTYRTFTAGLGWETSPVAEAASYVTEDGQLVLAGVPAEAPCDAPIAAVGTGGGAVLCDDEALARASSGDWTLLSRGVAAIGPADRGIALAIARTEECDGLTLGVAVEGALETVCSDISSTEPVAVSATAGQLWVWTADTVEILSR